MPGLKNLPTSLVMGLLATMMSAAAYAENGQPSCTDKSRECLIATVNRYIHYVNTGDGSDAPLAPTAKRWEAGNNTGDNATKIRAFKFPSMKVTDARFFVDEKTQNVLYCAMFRVPSTATTIAGTNQRRPAGPASLHICERIRVDAGLIHEIEAFFFFEDGTLLAPTAEPMNGLSIGSDNFPYIPLRNGQGPKPLKAPPVCTQQTRECMIKTAATYLDGTMNYDLSKVPVTSDWIRVEQGKVTGTAKGGTVLGPLPKDSLNWIGGHEGTRYFVDEKMGVVVALTMYRSSGYVVPGFITQGAPIGPVPLSMHRWERFRIENGLISEIEETYAFNLDMKTTNWPY